jgi:hypothetical protein
MGLMVLAVILLEPKTSCSGSDISIMFAGYDIALELHTQEAGIPLNGKAS